MLGLRRRASNVKLWPDLVPWWRPLSQMKGIWFKFKEGPFFSPTCVINIQDTVEQQRQWCRKGFLPSCWEAVSFDQITKLLHAFDLNVPTNLINTYIWILKRIYFFPSINVTWRFSSFHLWLKSEILHSKSILTLFINFDADRDPRQSWSLTGTVCLVAHFRCLD